MPLDVLIVGAGPTGLMLANQLARHGVRFRIIDRHPGPSTKTKALGVQARTLEIYARLGVIDEALRLGKKTAGANLWAGGRRTARIPVGDIGEGMSPYPFLLVLGQDDNERILGMALTARGLAVEWNTELTALTQSSDGVAVTLHRPDGSTEELVASWVAGCDGARSAVRDLNGIAFQGAPYQHVFFVADVDMTGPMIPDELNVYLRSQGFLLFFPMRGDHHWRLVGIVPPELRDREDLVLDAVLPSVRHEAGEGVALHSCSWFSTYRIHHRQAEHFRDRRCFLLGDAAHIHSPVGAQGMNTGLQDAYNLAWKLALVVAGQAGPALLDSYDTERSRVARRLLATTDRMFTLLVSDSRMAGLLRTRVIARVAAVAMRRRFAREMAFRSISQTGIRYRSSGLSENLPGLDSRAPQAGDRFPWLRASLTPDGEGDDGFAALDDTSFTLLHAGQGAPPNGGFGLDGRLRTVALDAGPAARDLARVGIPSPSFFLLRPDGYIGLAGTRLDPSAVRRYLAERIGIAAAG